MKYLRILGTACALTLALVSHSATALTFDANVTPDVIFGSGNANGSFTVDQSNGIELGLRGKLRFDASGNPQNIFNSNADGTYSFDAGVAPTKSAPVAVWSLEWTINSDVAGTAGQNLDDLTYVLGIDSDPGAGTSWSSSDIINVTNADHAIGTNATSNGGGATAANATDYANLIAANNVAQNSWQAHWLLAGFDPTVDGQYDFYLEARSLDGSTVLARTDISIIVGAGVVPVPASAWFFGSAIGLLGWIRRKTALPHSIVSA